MCRSLPAVTMSSIPRRAWSARRCGRRSGARFTRHLEIETYTWDVLPAALKIDVVGFDHARVSLGARDAECTRQPSLTSSASRRRSLGSNTPHLSAWAARGRRALITPAFPAVTCTAQADYLTGVYPERHGIVGNGWYFRDDCEVRFWRQSNKLVQAPKIWDTARAADSTFTCANLFWWFNMYSTADYAVTPRPIYRADGAKHPDIYTTPASLRQDLQSKLGTFPLFDFWGPRTSIKSSQWIADAAIHVDRQHNATLTLVYLPHLDYSFQRLGPRDPAVATDLREVDAVCGRLIEYFESRGARVIVLSEYGLADVSRPVHLNRVLREHGLLAVREELGGELLDAGASAAFAVADHQIAHVYVNDASKTATVRALLEKTPGVERVLDRTQQIPYRIAHDRSGDFVVIAESGAWFTYYYWLDDDSRARLRADRRHPPQARI